MQAIIDLKNDMNVPVSKGDENESNAPSEEDEDDDEESSEEKDEK